MEMRKNKKAWQARPGILINEKTFLKDKALTTNKQKKILPLSTRFFWKNEDNSVKLSSMSKNRNKYNPSSSDFQPGATFSCDRFLFSSFKDICTLPQLQLYWILQNHSIEFFPLSQGFYEWLGGLAKMNPRSVQRHIDLMRRKGILMRRTKAGWCKRIGWRKVSAIWEREHGNGDNDEKGRRWILKIPAKILYQGLADFQTGILDTTLQMYYYMQRMVYKDNATAVWYQKVTLDHEQGDSWHPVLSHRHLASISPIPSGSVRRLITIWQNRRRPGVVLHAKPEIIKDNEPLSSQMPAHLARTCRSVRTADGTKGLIVGTRFEMIENPLSIRRIRRPNLLTYCSIRQL